MFGKAILGFLGNSLTAPPKIQVIEVGGEEEDDDKKADYSPFVYGGIALVLLIILIVGIQKISN